MSRLDLLLEAEARGILPDDKKTLLAEARSRGLVKDTPEVDGADRAARRFRSQLTLGLADRPFDAFAAAGNVALGRSGERGFSEEYGRQRAKSREALSNEDGLNASDVAADTAGVTVNALASAPLTIARTAKEGLQEAMRFGAAYGVFGGYGHSKDDATPAETVGNMATEGATGAALGYGLQKGINLFGEYVTKPISNVLNKARTARAEHANQVAGDFEAAQVPEFTPALSDSGVVRGTAEELAGTVVGAPIRNSAQRSIEAVERGVQDELAAGGGRSAAEAGAETQDFLRKQLTERSIPGDEIKGMSPQQLQDISGVKPSPDYNPQPPRVAQEQPRQIEAISPEQHLAEVEAGVQPVAPRPALDIESRYKPPTVEDVQLSDEMVKKVGKAAASVADLQRRVQAESAAKRAIEEPLAAEMNDKYGIQSLKWLDNIKGYYGQRRVTGLKNSAGEPLPDQMRDVIINHDGSFRGQQPASQEEADFFKRLTKWLSSQGEHQANLVKSQQALEKATYERDIVAQEVNAYRTEELPKLAEQRRQQAKQEAQGAAESEASVATQKARTEARDRAAPTAVQDALQATERAQQAEAQRVATVNQQRQVQAEEAAQRDLAERRARPEEFTPGASKETFPTEFDAAYQANREAAPSVQRNPLGRRGTNERPEETTAVSQLLADIATEARGGGQLPGFKGPIFDQRGALREDVLAFLEPRLGKDITERLRYFSDRRAGNQFTPGLQGLLDVRTAMRRAAEDARRGSGHPANTRTEDDAMLTRMRGAIDDDIRRFAQEAGPAGEQFVRQRDAIDSAYESYINDLRKPLADLFDKMDSVQAISALIKDTQAKGNIDRLKAFFKVVDAKGDRLSATASLLHKMSEDGVEGFLKSWRALTPDAKAVMFQGAAKGMGEKLETLARVGGHLERYAKVAKEGATVDVGQILRPGNLGIGLTYFLSVPALISTALGSAAASKLLASKWYAGWLKSFPVEKGPASPEVQKHAARLRAFAIEQLGLNEAAADSILPNPAKAHPAPKQAAAAKTSKQQDEEQDQTDIHSRENNLRDSPWMPAKPDLKSRDNNSFNPDTEEGPPWSTEFEKPTMKLGGPPVIKDPRQTGEYDFNVQDDNFEIGEYSRHQGDLRMPDARFPQYPENGWVHTEGLPGSDIPDMQDEDGMQWRSRSIGGRRQEQQPDAPISDMGPQPGERWPVQRIKDSGPGVFASPAGIAAIGTSIAHGLFVGLPEAEQRLLKKGHHPGTNDEQNVADSLAVAGLNFGGPRPSGSLGAGGRPRFWTPDKLEKLGELRANGATLVEQAAALGVDVHQVATAARAYDLPRRAYQSSEGWTPNRKQQLKELWNSDKTTEAIGQELGVSPDAVTMAASKFREQLDLSSRRSSPVDWTDAKKEQLAQGYNDGKSLKEIAKDLDITPDNVKSGLGRYREELGLTKRQDRSNPAPERPAPRRRGRDEWVPQAEAPPERPPRETRREAADKERITKRQAAEREAAIGKTIAPLWEDGAPLPEIILTIERRHGVRMTPEEVRKQVMQLRAAGIPLADRDDEEDEPPVRNVLAKRYREEMRDAR